MWVFIYQTTQKRVKPSLKPLQKSEIPLFQGVKCRTTQKRVVLSAGFTTGSIGPRPRAWDPEGPKILRVKKKKKKKKKQIKKREQKKKNQNWICSLLTFARDPPPMLKIILHVLAYMLGALNFILAQGPGKIKSGTGCPAFNSLKEWNFTLLE